MRIGLTGHGTERLLGLEDLISLWIKNTMDTLCESNKDIVMLCGGADGADQLFGIEAFHRPSASLHLCIPVEGYRNKKMHPYIKAAAKEEHYMADYWLKGLDAQRDRYIVNNCDILLAVWDGGQTGGTWDTINYARSIGKPIIYFPRRYFKRARKLIKMKEQYEGNETIRDIEDTREDT